MKNSWLKYIIVILAFLILMIFVGDVSWLQRGRRARQIRALEAQRNEYRREIKAAERQIKALENTDTLERFAREQYLMHAPDEDIYLVEE